jgi:hypothetical protein
MGAGLSGLGYSCLIWRRMRKHGITLEIDLIDRLWYAFCPVLISR